MSKLRGRRGILDIRHKIILTEIDFSFRKEYNFPIDLSINVGE